MRVSRFVAVFALVALCATSASALTMTFTSRAAFDAAVTPSVFETFEAEALGVVGLPATFVESGLSVDVSPPKTTGIYSGNGFFPHTEGRKNLGVSGGDGDYTVSFTATEHLKAFGFDISGFQPGNFGSGGFGVELYSGATLFDSFFHVDGTTMFDGEFKGFVNNSGFDRINLTFSTTIGTSDFVGFDHISMKPIPEPGTFALVGLGLAGPRRRGSPPPSLQLVRISSDPRERRARLAALSIAVE